MKRTTVSGESSRPGRIRPAGRPGTPPLPEHRIIKKYLDLTEVIFVIIGRDQNVTLINKKGRRMLGYPERDIIGKNWFDHFLPGTIKEDVRAYFKQMMSGKKAPAREYENPVLTNNGRERLVRWRTSILPGTDGKPAGALSSGEDVTDRKQAEREILESEERYRALFDRSRDMVYLHDFQGRFIDANPAALKALGFNRGDIQCLTLADLLDPDQVDMAFRETRKVIARGTQESPFIYRVKRRTGETISIEIQASLVSRLGKPYAILGIGRDITDRLRTEKALRESERLYRTVVENMQDVFYRTDMDGKLVLASPSAARIFGYPSIQDFLGLDVAETIYENPADRKDTLEEIRKKGRVQNYEVVLKKRDGTRVIASTNSHLYYDEQGRPLGVEGVLYDITDRKKSEEALRESEARFRAVFEQSPDAMSLSLRDRHIFVNPAYLELFGYGSNAELAGRSFAELIAPQDRPKAVAEFDRWMDAGEGTVYAELHGLRKNGSLFDGEIHLSAYSLRGETHVVGLIRDISERKRAEEQIRAALEEKNILLREIHHRVNNNLQIISSLLNLQMRRVENPDLREMMQESQHRIRSIAGVHEQLYKSGDLSKIDFAGYLQSLVAHLFHAYRIDTNRIRPDIDLEPVFLNIETAIPAGLITTELVTNALKHAFPGAKRGILRVGLSRLGPDGFRLVVADDGIGFPADLDITTTESLGLQIVNLLIKQVEGDLRVDRAGGTAFTIEFKLQNYPARI
ncbi:MAG: PAS domain S-box protein [Candidatus Aminicenantales bacterium]